MLKTLNPRSPHNNYEAIPSKSVAHRALILAAFSEKPTHVICPVYGQDIEATIDCLEDIGANIEKKVDGFFVEPIKQLKMGILNAHDSATTYRIFEILIKYLDLKVSMTGSKRLMDRIHQDAPTSQHLSGKFIARAILSTWGREQIDTISELDDEFVRTPSKPYINITRKVLSDFGYRVDGDKLRSPLEYVVDGDWSLAAPWLVLGALTKEGTNVTGLDVDSAQGDREILEILKHFGAIVSVHADKISVKKNYSEMTGQKIDGSITPDLVPLIALLGACAEGTTEIRNIKYLKYKESDRLETTRDMINSLGGECEISDDGLIIHGKGKITGGTVNPKHDHRIIMAAAIASFVCEKAVRIRDTEDVAKSYPNFWTIIDG